jgi:hypothetical protein
LNYISIRINFNDFEENSAALCILKSCPNLQEIEMLVSDLLCAYVKFYVGCIVIFFLKKLSDQFISDATTWGNYKFLISSIHAGSPRGTS